MSSGGGKRERKSWKVLASEAEARLEEEQRQAAARGPAAHDAAIDGSGVRRRPEGVRYAGGEEQWASTGADAGGNGSGAAAGSGAAQRASAGHGRAAGGAGGPVRRRKPPMSVEERRRLAYGMNFTQRDMRAKARLLTDSDNLRFRELYRADDWWLNALVLVALVLLWVLVRYEVYPFDGIFSGGSTSAETRAATGGVGMERMG